MSHESADRHMTGAPMTPPEGMTDKQLLRIVASFRKGILGKRPSRDMCFAVCAPLATMLEMAGVRCTLVEVQLECVNHVWLRLADGRALDPTADQFDMPGGGAYPPIYLGAPAHIHRDQKVASRRLRGSD